MMDKDGIERNTEYHIYRGEDFDSADVDCITLKEARAIRKNPEPDVLLIEKVVRYWRDDGKIVHEERETFFDKEGGE